MPYIPYSARVASALQDVLHCYRNPPPIDDAKTPSEILERMLEQADYCVKKLTREVKRLDMENAALRNMCGLSPDCGQAVNVNGELFFDVAGNSDLHVKRSIADLDPDYIVYGYV